MALSPAAKRNRRVGTLFLAILLPPVAVYLETGNHPQFWLNLLLTACGFIPGMLHAVFVFLKPMQRGTG